MLDYQLTLLAIDFLKLMILLYEHYEVGYDLFCECCTLKIHFIENIIQDIPSIKKREEARLIVDKCKNLIGICS